MSDKKISQLTAATTPLDGTEVLPIVQGTTTKKVANNDLRPKQIQSNATSGVLQVTGPAAASTRVMTTPDANFTVARTDTGQTFTGSQTFSTDQDAITETIYNTKGSGLNNALLFLRADSDTSNDTFRAISYYNGGANNYRFYVTDSGQIWTKDNVVIGTSGKGIDFSATASGSGTMTSELLADYEEGTFTPVLNSFTSTNTPTTHGFYTKIGRQVTVIIEIYELSIGDISTTSSSYISGLPYASSGPSYGSMATMTTNVGSGSASNGYITSSSIYPGTSTASAVKYITCTYFAST